MRNMITPLFICLVFLSSLTGILKSDPLKLNGTWIPIKLEIGGTLLPKESFEKQKLIISDSNYTYIAESIDKGVVKYIGNKMDIYGRDGVNAG